MNVTLKHQDRVVQTILREDFSQNAQYSLIRYTNNCDFIFKCQNSLQFSHNLQCLQYNFRMQQKQIRNFPNMFSQSPREAGCQSPCKDFQQLCNNQYFQNTNKIVVQSKKQRRITLIESSTDCLEDLIQIYEWRNETQYPIISSIWKKVIFTHFTLEYKNKKQLTTFLEQNTFSSNVKVQVETQTVTPLQYCKPLSVAQWMYAFKESIIAFERLYSLFGSYSVTPKMITINQEGKLKVWLSPNYDQNIKSEDQNSSQGQVHIVSALKNIFTGFSQDTHTFRQILSNTNNIRTFIGLLRFIEEYSISKKKIIAKKIIKRPQIPIKRPQSPIVNLKPLRPLTRHPTFVPFPLSNNLVVPSKLISPIIARKSVKYQKSQFDIETNQTLSPQSNSKIFQNRNEFNTFGAKYGKIVKNRMNVWLQNAKSMKNLQSNTKMSPQTKDRLEPNSLQKNINRLFEEQFTTRQVKQQSNLMKLGRSVRQSITQ